MKIRNGFVSNSSSSSFVVMVPRSFKFDDDFDFESDKEKVVFDEMLDCLRRGESITSYDFEDKGIDAYETWALFEDVMQPFVIRSFETGPDEGCIMGLCDKDVGKINELWTDKLS